jgi:hypothetical protein
MGATHSRSRAARLFRAAALAILLAGTLALTACAGKSAPDTSRSGQPLASAPASHGAHPVVLGPSDSSSPVALQTQMRQFAPLDEHGTLTVAAESAGSGSCFATSIAVPLSGVYRCLADNTIYDPCFAPARETSPATVVCFADPWSSGQTLTLTRALPTYDPDLTDGNPWALELANGARCVSVTGAVPALGDVDLTYACTGGSVAGLSTSDDGSMMAHYGPASGPLTDVGVSVAWRGRSYRLAG